MRIVHVHKAYPPVIGGIERHIAVLAAAQARAGHDVAVVCCHARPRTEIEHVDGVRVIRAARWGKLSSMPISPSLRAILRAQATEVVHVHTPFPLGEWAASTLPANVAVVASWHSDIVRQKVLRWLYRPFQVRFLRRCDRVLVATPHHLSSSTQLSPARDRCLVVPYGIDAPPLAAPQHPIPVSRPYVLFVGRLVGYKGVAVLLRAWKLVHARASLSALRLVLVGRGPLESKLRHQAKQLGIDTALTWLPHVNEPTLDALYRQAVMLVLPSTSNNEAFGLVQLEAMARGTPVVATRLPTGVSYLNSDGQTGLLAEVGNARSLADCIVTLCENETLRSQLAAAARTRAEQCYSLKAMLDGVERAYRDAMQHGR